MKRKEFLFKLPLSVFGIFSLQLLNSCRQRDREKNSDGISADSLLGQTREKLWLLYNCMLINWSLNTYSNITKADFDLFLENRISFHKNYIHTYNAMADKIQENAGNFNSLQKQLSDLDDAETIRTIIQEFQTYAIVNGGFRKFHLKNYYGFIGGSYADSNSLPYRT